jgi:hypothetical protein
MAEILFPHPMSRANEASPVASARSGAFAAITCGGAVSGVLDISFAIASTLMHGRTIGWLFKLIAGGALGREAQEGGAGTAALGLFFHFCVSFSAATVYFFASRKLPALVRHPWIAGPAFGLLVNVFMNSVVLPLSAYHRPFGLPSLLNPDLLSHLFFVGLPIALFARRFAPR